MRFKPLAALAAISLVVGSSAATAQSVAPAAPVVDRAGAQSDEANELFGGSTILIIGAVVLALAIWGIIELTDDDEEPVSP
ncbi:hypothetical protein [Sphingosinicella terrae]|uniref:hypothetical protein n=1 Tax=Sphingosinicella terrae TaxID=2172047 RepID=UPI000E0CDB87|nr:hypothetical protein [Sphingosinicella terrae]